ncbi:electron transfer protein 1 [Cylindrobasidium torrendii FP15055 ss-10]|uniref:Electron transfer protein 1 n=1 Tax=Cylindrobasidium torrendii FP15055 ss-10 TaxID=1314674 RepID=A0A0D7BS18_9AGAR|nr:electron transfer protein 1 [Cylindrobasidium torrendii FP15055 ss-10]
MFSSLLRAASAPSRAVSRSLTRSFKPLSASRNISCASQHPVFSALKTANQTWSSKARLFSHSATRRTPVAATEPPPKSAADALPVLPTKGVGIWLMISSTLVFTIIVVGGITRLTESGLSITEWKPVTGSIPPLSKADWEEEFDKYKQSPEFKMLNHSITIEDFKRIFFWEWSHRFLGRFTGLVFVVPLAYFIAKKRISRSLAWKLSAASALFAAQGAMGWYMVKSGLDEELIRDTPSNHPRVSHYRLAAHLCLAFILYASMFSTGISTIKEYKFATGGLWNGQDYNAFKAAAQSSFARGMRWQTRAAFALVFLTAMSGAFVAGLDAGLVYNEWPFMGEKIHPPRDELFDKRYAREADKSDLFWRNMLENPVTVQFNHRMLAYVTYAGTALLYLQSRRRAVAFPPAARHAIQMAFLMANVQVLLGITTLINMVPTPLAASHQAGSVLLLTAMIHALVAFRRPGAAAQAWRIALKQTKA